MDESMSAYDEYEQAMSEARKNIDAGALANRLLGDSLSPIQLHLFLIYRAALGIQIVEPVEAWIRGAAQACATQGRLALSNALQNHAAEESGHHLMHISDLRFLIEYWNRVNTTKLDLVEFSNLPPTLGMRGYIALHEEVIRSQQPFAQVAIEYEIEGLSVRLGQKLVKRWISLLGLEVVQGLTFLREHARLDTAHTEFNRDQMKGLLIDRDNCLEPLVAAGKEALRSFHQYHVDCWDLAVQRSESMSAAQ